MRWAWRSWIAFGALLVLAGCDAFGGGSPDAAHPAGGGDAATGGSGVPGGSVPGGADVGLPLAGSWWSASSPCPGSTTDALWFDDEARGFAGCGENAEGAGLWRTADGGSTWSAEPAFADVRVMDLRRGPDGVLYGAGVHRSAGYSAWRCDESGGALAPVALFTPGDDAFTSVAQGENVAVAADGQMLVDSLTGTNAAWRPAGGDFVELHSLLEEALTDPDAPGVQVRRVVAVADRFYACGSVINEPAQVFLPSRQPGATWHLERLRLQPPAEDGELLDLHVWSPERAIAVGFDHSGRSPLVYVLDGAAAAPASWQRIDLAAQGSAAPAGLNALHVVGDVVVAVGEQIPTTRGGLVLRSTDAGRTWQDVTPTPDSGRVGALSEVWLFANGDVFAAGGGREAWRLTAE